MRRKVYPTRFGVMSKLQETIVATVVRFPEAPNKVVARNIGTSAMHVSRTKHQFADVISRSTWSKEEGYVVKE